MAAKDRMFQQVPLCLSGVVDRLMYSLEEKRNGMSYLVDSVGASYSDELSFVDQSQSELQSMWDNSEIKMVVQRSNSDGSQIRKADGTEGFVQAKCVVDVPDKFGVDIDSKVTKNLVKRPRKVPEKVKGKKTVTKKVQ